MARIPLGDRRADVADQEGLKNTLLGLGLAIFIGLIARSSLNSDYVAEQIRIAAQKIHQDLKIDFASARVSLSDQGIPELAAIVETIKFSSSNACWSEPEGQIDELRLPLNLWELIKGNVEISEVKIGYMNLKLQRRWQDCGSQANVQTTAQASQQVDPVSASSAISKLETAVTRPQARGPIVALSIESLRIEYLPFSTLPFDFENVSLERTSADDLEMQLTGLLNLGGTSLSGDYASQAEFLVDLKKSKINLSLQGTWREGKYQVKADYDSEKRDIEIRGNIDNLPLSQILNLLTQFNAIEGEYDSRQLWLTFDFTTDARYSVDQPIPLKIPNFSLEGDLGEVKGENLQIQIGSGFVVSPGELRLRGIKPEKILTLLGKESKFQSFGSLGQMNGNLFIKDLQNWSFQGESSGLELVFSNRGERKLQILSIISGRADFKEGDWVLLVDKVRPLDGLFLGSLRLEGFRSKPHVELEVLVEELSLSNEVQALMSGGGSMGRWSGEIKGVFVKNSPKQLSGVLTGQSILIEGLSADRLRVSLSESNDRISTELKAQGLEILPGTALRRFFSTLFAPAKHDGETPLRASQVAALLQFGSQTDELQWKIRPVNFEGLEMRSEGGWSQIFELFGNVKVSYKGQEFLWKVEGDREKPIFTQK